MKPQYPKTDAKIRPDAGIKEQNRQFMTEVWAVLQSLREFRSWIEHRKKIDVPFMKEYKARMEREIGPSIAQFDEKYGQGQAAQSPFFSRTKQIVACLRRPIAYMETELRPSVGLGVWQARWMLTKAVEDYLRLCCQEADPILEKLIDEVQFGADVDRSEAEG